MYEGCAPLKVRGECEVGQGRWSRVAVDRVKTKSWYFSWCVKVSIPVEFLRLGCFSLYRIDGCVRTCGGVCCIAEMESTEYTKMVYLAIGGKKSLDSLGAV